jgi:hypothetical protein
MDQDHKRCSTFEVSNSRSYILNGHLQTPICHHNESVFLCVPWPRIETPLVPKRVVCMLWKVSSHCRAHSPCQQLDSIAGERYSIRFEVVERRDTASDDDPEGSEKPKSEGENWLAVLNQ